MKGEVTAERIAAGEVTTRHAVANNDLQSTSYWAGRYAIDQMEATHLLNAMRLLLRKPIRQILASENAHSWAVAQMDDWPTEPDDLPDGGHVIVQGIRDRQARDRQLRELEDNLDEQMFSDVADQLPFVPTMDYLREQADAWIRRQPTFVAMQERLLKWLLSGAAELA